MKVYRLRNLPVRADRQLAVELLVACTIGVSPYQVRIASLAHVIDPWTRPSTKTATLTIADFDPNAHSQLSSGPGQWTLHTPGLAEPLILDYHFHGLTPLNDVDPEFHEYDCIAISGLASHPFGSWQPHGGDKSFMWIRDKLPQFLPAVRFATYGYETRLYPSTSFQSVPDLAISLISVLKSCGWSSPSAKPLIFLAHSLGGAVLKQALVMLAGSGQTETFISTLIRGIIFFGVPSRGMPINDILTMLGGQPNKDALVTQISDTSDYLQTLEHQFDGISFLRTVKLFWAYETKTTQTIAEVQGRFTRCGPSVVLVTKESATGGRSEEHPLSTIQIDENHSDMVKFSQGDHRIHVLASKLGEICGSRTQSALAILDLSNEGGSLPQPRSQQTIPPPPALPEPPVWDDKRIIESLRPPELGARVNQIDPHADHTFHWAFDEPSIGLSQWLRRGRGIFWISGKPGSGKSTLMKFLHRDPRTSELMHRWGSTTRQVTASFFFHYRGTALQKSFEGLLRGIISQVVEAKPAFFPLLRSILDDIYNRKAQREGLDSLQRDLKLLTHNAGCRLTTGLNEDIENIIRDQNGLSSLRETLVSVTGLADSRAFQRIEGDLTRFRDISLKSGGRPRKEGLLRHQCWVDTGLASLSETCVSRWLKRLDLDARVRSILNIHGIHGDLVLEQKAPLSVGGEPRIRFHEGIENGIKTVVKNQMQREKLRIEVQDGGWPRERLENILRQICLQDHLDLDLCLFLDALDEYDGRPEFVSQFLKDLTEESAFPRTKIRILFSSRPWTHFQEEFAACPGFRIQDHTQDDIRNYCITTIPDEVKAVCNLRHLVDEIVARSSGVFLWVRLVVSDLKRVVADNASTSLDVNERFRQTLESLPNQLNEYYATIIERIPSGLRWKSYVVLETLARSDFNLAATDLVRIIAVSESRTPSYYSPNWDIYGTAEQMESAEELVRGVSGGLIDIVNSPSRSASRSGVTSRRQVQLMHQTVKDFVTAPRFRHLVLGRRRAEVTEENGHSFIAKYLLFPDNVQDARADELRLYTHLRRAEETTGVSQHEFLYGLSHNYLIGLGVTSPLSFAAKSGLRLLIKDAHQKDPMCIAQCRDRLLTDLLSGVPLNLSPDEAVKTAESFLSRGFVVEQDVEGLTELMRMIFLDDTGPRFKQPRPDPYYVPVSITVAGYLKDLSISLRWADRRGQLLSYEFDGNMIHLATPEIAARLLDRGANPNAMMKAPFKGSPIDYIISSWSIHPSSPSYLYELAQLLLKYGGKPHATTPKEWSAFLTHLALDGFDIDSDLWHPYPLENTHCYKILNETPS